MIILAFCTIFAHSLTPPRLNTFLFACGSTTTEWMNQQRYNVKQKSFFFRFSSTFVCLHSLDVLNCVESSGESWNKNISDQNLKKDIFSPIIFISSSVVFSSAAPAYKSIDGWDNIFRTRRSSHLRFELHLLWYVPVMSVHCWDCWSSSCPCSFIFHLQRVLVKLAATTLDTFHRQSSDEREMKWCGRWGRKSERRATENVRKITN